jgi:hypothetical protein
MSGVAVPVVSAISLNLAQAYHPMCRMAGLSINCHHGKEDLKEIPPQLNRGETL